MERFIGQCLMMKFPPLNVYERKCNKYEDINEQSITEKKMKSFLSRLFSKVRDEKFFINNIRQTQTPPAVQFAFGRVHNI